MKVFFFYQKEKLSALVFVPQRRQLWEIGNVLGFKTKLDDEI